MHEDEFMRGKEVVIGWNLIEGAKFEEVGSFVLVCPTYPSFHNRTSPYSDMLTNINIQLYAMKNFMKSFKEEPALFYWIDRSCLVDSMMKYIEMADQIKSAMDTHTQQEEQ